MAGRSRIENEKDRRISRSITLPVRVWELLSSMEETISVSIEKAVKAMYEKNS